MKAFGGEFVTAGSIIVRQCGTKFHPGENVGLAKDFTIYSLIDGFVKFSRKGRDRKVISIEAASN